MDIPDLTQSKLKTIKACFEIVTPMFLGDQNGKCSTNIRPTAFKGALRFWWRALQWSQCITTSENTTEALKKLHQKEADLFGIDANQGGQGLFLITVESNDLQFLSYKDASLGKKILAYGMQEDKKKSKPSRDAIDSNQIFNVKIIAKPSITDSQYESLLDALKILGLLGSLGAKSRKGFGSLGIKSLCFQLKNQDFNFKEPSEYYQSIESVLTKYPIASVTQLPPFSAFSAETHFGKVGRTFNEMAQKYKQFSEENQQTSEKENAHNKKFLGLPRIKGGYGSERRSSPLLIHIHKVQGKEHPFVVLIPAIWQPNKIEESSFKDFSLPRRWILESGQKISINTGA